MNIRSTFVWVGVLALAPLGTTLAAQDSRYPTSSPYQTQSQVFSPRTSDRQIQQVLTRLRTDAEALRQTVDASAPRGRAYGNRARQTSDEVFYLVDDLLQAADHLNDHIIRRQVIRADVDDVLRRGVLIESALQRSSVQNSQLTWNRVRRDLDDLAAGYGMPANWRNGDDVASAYSGGAYERLTGTYQLDLSRSDNPRLVADRALGQVPAAQRTRIADHVYARIEAPDVISIDRTGNRVTIASSRAPQMTFDADGQPHAEQVYGGSMTTRANVYGDRLEVDTSGGMGTDYSATFEPLDNGQSLRLTRRIFDESLRQPIIVQSVYRRTSDTAQWDVYDARTRYSTGDRTAVYRGTPSTNLAIVPDGTRLVATLDQDVSTRAARQNDRVTLTVRNAPRADLEGAVIQGYLVDAPSQSNGRTGVSIDFNEIRLRNGQTASFAGTVEAVRGPNGQQVGFDADQSRDPNAQRDQAIQRGAIGATVGAIIGAIAGGGKGAAIGAVLGGGGGAATVYMDMGQANLPRGTEFTIRSRTPYRP